MSNCQLSIVNYQLQRYCFFLDSPTICRVFFVFCDICVLQGQYFYEKAVIIV